MLTTAITDSKGNQKPRIKTRSRLKDLMPALKKKQLYRPD
uniref:Uncharacterized protein n=1 Tax=Anguilla anguilla TaxID=7936 RepID=A0A0E9QK81_ANGAN